jgi:hypothetical protein
MRAMVALLHDPFFSYLGGMAVGACFGYAMGKGWTA